MYFPLNHYWIRADGAIYSSRVNALVAADAPAYLDWLRFNAPTPWPRSEAGVETTEALADVLAPYGVIVDVA